VQRVLTRFWLVATLCWTWSAEAAEYPIRDCTVYGWRLDLRRSISSTRQTPTTLQTNNSFELGFSRLLSPLMSVGASAGLQNESLFHDAKFRPRFGAALEFYPLQNGFDGPFASARIGGGLARSRTGDNGKPRPDYVLVESQFGAGWSLLTRPGLSISAEAGVGVAATPSPGPHVGVFGGIALGVELPEERPMEPMVKLTKPQKLPRYVLGGVAGAGLLVGVTYGIVSSLDFSFPS